MLLGLFFLVFLPVRYQFAAPNWDDSEIIRVPWTCNSQDLGNQGGANDSASLIKLMRTTA